MIDTTEHDPGTLVVDVNEGAHEGVTGAIELLIDEYEHELGDAETDDERTFEQNRERQITTLEQMLANVRDNNRLQADQPVYEETLTDLKDQLKGRIEAYEQTARCHEHEARHAMARGLDLEAFYDEYCAMHDTITDE